MEEKFEIEMFDEAVLPKSKRKGWSVYAEPLTEFVKSDKKTIKFKFKNTGAAKRGYGGLKSYVKNHKLNIVFYLRGVEVYLIKG